MESTRREFIKNGTAFLSLGMAAPAFLAQAAAEAQSAKKAGRQAQTNILVVLQLSGGNDGLNTVIPYTDSLYYKARPTIAIPRAEVVAISDKIGLHPAMAALKPLYEKGEIAVIQGVGYPNPDRSHFRSMEIWQTGDPELTVPGTGWLGRWFDAEGHLKKNALAGINLGGELPRTLYADYGTVVSMQNPQSYQFQAVSAQDRAAALKAFRELYAQGTQAHSYADLIRKVGARAYTSSEKIREAVKSKSGEEAALGAASGQSLEVAPGAAGNPGGESQLRSDLRAVAQLIGADLGTQVYYLSTGGYDTHAAQPDAHANLLRNAANSIAAFFTDLEKRGLADSVTLVVFSEFGRRVYENYSSGTDHGAASLMFVIGGKVRGGLYGKYPALDDLWQGDLKHNVDFRQVYATLLDAWLGTSSQKILKGRFEPLRFLHADA